MVSQLFSIRTQRFVPIQSRFFPVRIPFLLRTRLHEKLHLHLFKFTHTEYKLTSNDLISKRLSYLCNTKWQLLTRSLLHIQVIHKYTLSRLWSQVQLTFFTRYIPQLCIKHQIKLTDIRPIFRSRYWAINF